MLMMALVWPTDLHTDILEDRNSVDDIPGLLARADDQ